MSRCTCLDAFLRRNQRQSHIQRLYPVSRVICLAQVICNPFKFQGQVQLFKYVGGRKKKILDNRMDD